MKINYLLLSCLMVGLLACSPGGSSPPQEPEGKAVTLSQKELSVSFMKENFREWYAWHHRGIELMQKGRYDEALYCLHQALKAWPKEDGDNILNQLPCPFLKDNKCTQYDSRPVDCISYPHLQKKDFVFRLIGVVNNYSICPIVFNVYEALKNKLKSEFIDFQHEFDKFGHY